jgi:DNA-directed RNA polymerase II subunit RPB1
MTDEPGKGDEGGGEASDDVFLKKIESSMLSQVKLQGIQGIRKVFLREAKRTRLDPATAGFITDNEWVLDTEGGAPPARGAQAALKAAPAPAARRL